MNNPYLSALFSKKSHVMWVASLSAVVLSFILFGNGLGGKFLLDDGFVIVGNPLINYNLNGFWKIFVSPYHFNQPLSGLYRPLVIASYALNWFVFGDSPASFHAVNILLHALVVFLIFALVSGFSNYRTGAMAALLFMFLPIHVEDVTSIVGRAEILAMLFFILALIAVSRERWFWAGMAFFLALLSKENSISFLPLVLFWQCFYQKKSWHFIKKTSFYFLSSIALYAFLRGVALGSYFLSNDGTMVYNPIKFAPFRDGLWTAFKVFFLYLQKTFVPGNFSSDYSFNAIPLVHQPLSSWPTLAGLACLAILAWVLVKRRDTLIGLGAALFLFSYFIISNWLFKTGTIMGERLLYLPSLGLVMMVAGGVAELWPKIKFPKLIYAGLGAVLIWHGAVLINRNRVWLSEPALFESAYAAAPQSVVNMTNMAYLDYTKKEYGEAQQRIDAVLRLMPDHIPAINLAGHIYKKQGKIREAEEFWKKAIRNRHDFLRAYSSLGALYYENGYLKSAEKILTEAVAIYPRWSEVFLLSLTKSALGQYDEAISLIEKNFGKEPQKELKFALGIAYYKRGDKLEGERYLRAIKDPSVSMESFLQTVETTKIFVVGEF